MNLGTALTILGILITAVGLVALRPQLSVSPSDSIERSQPFSAPFKVSNIGLLALHNVKIHVYIHRVEVGPMTATRSVVGNKEWAVDKLERGESKTIISNFVHAPMPPRKADIAIVVDYNATGIPLKRLRRVFRFVGAYVDVWQWLQQPSDDIRADVDAMINPHDPN